MTISECIENDDAISLKLLCDADITLLTKEFEVLKTAVEKNKKNCIIVFADLIKLLEKEPRRIYAGKFIEAVVKQNNSDLTEVILDKLFSEVDDVRAIQIFSKLVNVENINLIEKIVKTNRFKNWKYQLAEICIIKYSFVSFKFLLDLGIFDEAFLNKESNILITVIERMMADTSAERKEKALDIFELICKEAKIEKTHCQSGFDNLIYSFKNKQLSYSSKALIIMLRNMEDLSWKKIVTDADIKTKKDVINYLCLFDV